MTHDTYIFRLEFPEKDWISGLWVGGHFTFHGEVEKGRLLSRKYTPITPICTRGYAEFAIKIYREHDDYPDGGKFSQFLESKSVGDTISCEAPMGKFKYLGFGSFEIKREKLKDITHIILICAGTGLTPHLSIVQASLLS